MMVEKLIGKLSSHRRTKIYVAVRDRDLPAQLLFRAMGFEALNVLRSYFENWDDAYWMRYRVENSGAGLAESPATA